MASDVSKPTLATPSFPQLAPLTSVTSKPNPDSYSAWSYSPGATADSQFPYAHQGIESNTTANSHPHQEPVPRGSNRDNTNRSNGIEDHHSSAQAPNLGIFTEEWDASQRGASILDDHSANMQRPSSYHAGYDEDHISLPSRGNTLKKKSSLRRNASLGRSGSRRSMKAGSVRSLALQSTSDPDEANSAFYCPVPTSGSPTEVLANRFNGERPTSHLTRLSEVC